jgi:hypothetical protein
MRRRKQFTVAVAMFAPADGSGSLNSSSRKGEGIVSYFRGNGIDCDDRRNVVMVKQYIGKHRVLHRGVYDGEGTIYGTWSIGEFWKGPFALSPVQSRPAPYAPIQDIS